MTYILYLYLAVLVCILLTFVTSHEYMTVQQQKPSSKLEKRVKKLESDYSDILQKMKDQQSTMKSASDQAAAAKASITAAVAS
jgi:hypothetical protein